MLAIDEELSESWNRNLVSGYSTVHIMGVSSVRLADAHNTVVFVKDERMHDRRTKTNNMPQGAGA